MKIHLSSLILTAALFIVSGITVAGQDIGEAAFKQTCGACHTIGRGRLVGPDLAGVEQRLPQEWIIKFVKSSQSVIKSGDKYADSLFQAYNQLPMPDNPNLSDEQIKEILTYIQTKSANPVGPSTATGAEQSDQKAGNNAGNLFSTTNIFLFGLILFMLLVIISLARINKNLLDQIRDYYSSDRSFFKKPQ